MALPVGQLTPPIPPKPVRKKRQPVGSGPHGMLNINQFYAKYGGRFGARGTGAYTRYVKYINKRATQAAAAQDGHATSTSSTTYDYLNPTPRGQLLPQASAFVRAQINPQIKALYQQAALDAARGSKSIMGLTRGYQNFIAPLPGMIAGIYDAAGKQANLANAVNMGGQTAAANTAAGALAASAQQIGAPAQSQGLVGAVGQFGKSSAGLQAARGAAQAANIATVGGGATGYAAALPAIAQLGAQQDLRLLNEQINTGTSKARQALLAQIPSLTQDIYQRLLDREMQKAVAKNTISSSQAQIDAANQRALLSQQGQDARTAFTQGQIGGRTTQQINAQNTRARKAREAAAAKAAAAAAVAATKIKQADIKAATALAQGMFTGKVVTGQKLIPDPNLLGPPTVITTKTIVGRKNANEASVAITAWLRARYPNASQADIHHQMLLILGAAGYKGTNISYAAGTRKPPLPNKKVSGGRPG